SWYWWHNTAYCWQSWVCPFSSAARVPSRIRFHRFSTSTAEMLSRVAMVPVDIPQPLSLTRYWSSCDRFILGSFACFNVLVKYPPIVAHVRPFRGGVPMVEQTQPQIG